MALPHKTATQRHVATATTGSKPPATLSNTGNDKSRLQRLAGMCGHGAIARHLKNRGYTIEQTLDLLALPRRYN